MSKLSHENIRLSYFCKYISKEGNAISDIDKEISTEILNRISSKKDHAFFVVDLPHLARKYQEWKEKLPRVKPFYAVKCNPDLMIIKTLGILGVGFDCASKAEIELVLSFNIASDRIIFANPCKPISHIEFAKKNGVRLLTFDNADELHKINSVYPEANLILRILADDPTAKCQFGKKFGTSMSEVSHIFQESKKIGQSIVGISFHVGSGCHDSIAFARACSMAKEAFELGKQHGYNFNYLDIGGGFPGTNKLGEISFTEIAAVLQKAIDSDFLNCPNIIAEPGRYFAASSCHLATQITSRRVTEKNGEKKFMYYINDGVYGSFNCIMFDHSTVEPNVTYRAAKADGADNVYESSIWGPTCDSIDCIAKEVRLPELKIGDWLQFNDMGKAYTLTASSTFNGFEKPKMEYLHSSE